MQPTIYGGLLLNVKDDEWKIIRNKKSKCKEIKCITWIIKFKFKVDVTDTTVVPAYYGHDRRVYSTYPL